jgi:hypothetical protein
MSGGQDSGAESIMTVGRVQKAWDEEAQCQVPVNLATPLLDAGNVYGTDESFLHTVLRERDSCKMKVSSGNLLPSIRSQDAAGNTVYRFMAILVSVSMLCWRPCTLSGCFAAFCCRLRAACCVLPAACCLLPAACCLLPAICRLLHLGCTCVLTATNCQAASHPESTLTCRCVSITACATLCKKIAEALWKHECR